MRADIENLIEQMKNGKVTAYKVSSQSGVSQALLARLKSEEVKISNLKLETVEKLSNYYTKEFLNMEQFIKGSLVEGTVTVNEEGLIKGNLNDNFKIHYADYGDAQNINVFHANGKQANEFKVRNEDDVNYVKEQIKAYNNM